MTRLPVLLAVLLASAALLLTGCGAGSTGAQPSPGASSSASHGLPSQTRWLADVHAVMGGSNGYLDARLAKPGASKERLAINLDIDNTALASQYDFGAPVPDVLRFARDAHRRGVAVLFNTARADRAGQSQLARQQLEKAGYPVDEVCLRGQDQDVVKGKQDCRRHFVAEGYKIIANIGNNDTDFQGGDYERAFRLPNYGSLS
jgi:hypothetical protein